MLHPSARIARFSRSLVPLLLLAISMAAPQPGMGAEALPAAELFFAPPIFLKPQLSPDGSKVCALTRFDKGHQALTMIDLAAKRTRTLVKSPGMSVINYWWKGENLFLLLVESDEGEREFQSLDLASGKINTVDPNGAYAALEFLNPLPHETEEMLFRSIRQNSLTIAEQIRLSIRQNMDMGPNDLSRVNLRTGKLKSVEPDPGGVRQWFVNPTGEPLAGWGKKDEQSFLLWRKSPEAKWTRLNQPKGELPPVVPMVLAQDGRLIARDYRRGPTAAVCYYDPATGATEEIFPPGPVEPDGFQYWGPTRQPTAIIYETDTRQLRFMDPSAEGIHQWMESVLPGTNRDYIGFSADSQTVLVLAYNNRNPGVYCVANTATRKITMLNPSYASLNPTQMQPSRHFSFQSTGGLTVTGRITLPQNVPNPPCVIINDWDLAGPRARDSFDRAAQFFATRGLAAVRINHRGTAGFGRDFARAGDLQVATGMVDDLAAGIEWLGAQGWIDGKRVAVIGEGCSGWIAFPLAARPGLIKALVNFGTIIEPTDSNLFDIAPVLTSGLGEDELPGGAKTVKAYRATLNPLVAAEKLTIPTFHYYNRSVFAGRLQAILRKNGQEHVFINSHTLGGSKSNPRLDWEQLAERYEQAAAFLQKHL